MLFNASHIQLCFTNIEHRGHADAGARHRDVRRCCPQDSPPSHSGKNWLVVFFGGVFFVHSAQTAGAAGVMRGFKDLTANSVMTFCPAEHSERRAVSRLHGRPLKESTRGSSALCDGGELAVACSSFGP